MTILTKLSNLLTSAIELPNALHACVEMAREAESSRAIVAEHDDAQICGKLAARIVELERDLDREREARRWRRLKVDDGVDGLTIVLFRQPSRSASRDTRTTLRMHLTEERYPGCEWRYLSPENMP